MKSERRHTYYNTYFYFRERISRRSHRDTNAKCTFGFNATFGSEAKRCFGLEVTFVSVSMKSGKRNQNLNPKQNFSFIADTLLLQSRAI